MPRALCWIAARCAALGAGGDAMAEPGAEGLKRRVLLVPHSCPSLFAAVTPRTAGAGGAWACRLVGWGVLAAWA